MPTDTTTYPYDTIALVETTIGGQDYQGSGVLISPDELLTASHVVYGAGVGVASDIVVAPGYNSGSEPFGIASGTFVHYFAVGNSDDTISFADSQNDYAVIHLSRAFTGLGTMGLLPNFPGGTVEISGYPGDAGGAQITDQQVVAQDPDYTLLDDTAIGEGSSGGPLWVVGSNGSADVVGVTSSETAGPGSDGFAAQITSAAYQQIEAWVAQDDGLDSGAPSIAVDDTTTGMTVPATADPYTGPVAGLQDEYIDITSDSLNIAVGSPNWFIHSGSGNDAIAVSSGDNVLDGGTGSNFLTGGSGSDTFFVDDRGPLADIWSTVANFHAGDSATIWGVTTAAFSLNWEDNQGAAGYTGLTLHATATGVPTASLTLVGFSSADLSDGVLSVSYGTDAASGSAYMYVHDNA